MDFFLESGDGDFQVHRKPSPWKGTPGQGGFAAEKGHQSRLLEAEPLSLGQPLRADLLFLVCLGLLAPWPRSKGGGRPRRRAWVFPVVMGGLSRAATVSPLVALPWLLLPGLWMAWAWAAPAAVRERGALNWRRNVLLALSAMSLNGTAVAVATAHGVRLPPQAFAQEDFRVNHLLNDIPVHDAWSISLPGSASPTLENLTRALRKRT